MNNELCTKRSSYFYDLPPELIAQTPAEPRDHSRLLICKKKLPLSEGLFSALPSLLKAGDVLVLNETRVIPARLFAVTHDGDGNEKPLEILLLRQQAQDVWEVLTKPGKRAKCGQTFRIGDALSGTVLEITDGGNRLVRFDYDHSEPFFSLLDKLGNTPLPPYITKKCEDTSRYQTVYARHDGSAAAPTAGLHFTPALLDAIRNMGVIIAPVTLHVGLGTFRPVKEEDITKHLMHNEFFSVPKETADQVNLAKAEGRRVIAVGTTSLRTLEGASDENGTLLSGDGNTSIFIYPGYRFKIPDGLITNFHLPESTLIMLVSAFMGYDETMAAYRYAVDNRFRFFSFGDAMFIERKDMQ